MPYVSNKRHTAKLNEYIQSIEIWAAHVQDCADKFGAELTNLHPPSALQKEITDLLTNLRRDSLLLKSKSKKIRRS